MSTKKPTEFVSAEDGHTQIQISAADADDAARLYPIFHSVGPNYADAEARGFLLSRYDPPEFAAFLAQCEVYAATLDALPVGFGALKMVNARHFDGIAWQSAEQAQIVLEQRPLYWIHMLAVAPHAGRRGVATALYTRLFEEYPTAAFITGLYEAPLDNRASRAFHLRQGFQRIGESRRLREGESTVRVSGIYWRGASGADIDGSRFTL